MELFTVFVVSLGSYLGTVFLVHFYKALVKEPMSTHNIIALAMAIGFTGGYLLFPWLSL